MLSALSRMERELGCGLAGDDILSAWSQQSAPTESSDANTETIVDFQSISLELSNTPPPSPLELKRREIPELSPHRSSENIANLGNLNASSGVTNVSTLHHLQHLATSPRELKVAKMKISA